MRGPCWVAIATGALASLYEPRTMGAQTLQIAASGAAMTNSEITGVRQAKGIGFGIAARAERSRLRLDTQFLHAALRADFSIQPDYVVDEIDIRLTYLWRPYLGGQIGFARRFTHPEFVAQDVGLLRVGLVSEARLARIAGLWVRGAYLPVSRLSGGGKTGLGLELGIGAELGPPNTRLQGFVAFDYQRINRNTSTSVPLQYSAGQAGVRVRLR
jgi:hypothetical protein